MASATVFGNYGGESFPQVNFTSNGTAVISLNIAENFGPDSRGNARPTQWHRVVVWGDLAESLVQTLKKGDRLIVVGQLKNKDYTDRNGIKRTQTEIHATDIGYSVRWNTVVSEREASDLPEGSPVRAADFDGDEGPEEDIPF